MYTVPNTERTSRHNANESTRKRSIDAIGKRAHAEVDPGNDLVGHETVPVEMDMVVDWFVVP